MELLPQDRGLQSRLAWKNLHDVQFALAAVAARPHMCEDLCQVLPLAVLLILLFLLVRPETCELKSPASSTAPLLYKSEDTP